MKSRLESLPLTDEDIDVWVWVHKKWCGIPWSEIAARSADRRDAELMLGLQLTIAALDRCDVPRSEFRRYFREDIERIAAKGAE
jgi:hypothetical protein